MPYFIKTFKKIIYFSKLFYFWLIHTFLMMPASENISGQPSLTGDPVFIRSGNFEELTNLNRKKYFQKKSILHFLYTRGILSNPEICKLTNLSSPSINKLLKDLINDGLVQEEGIGQSIGGRRPNIFGLKPDSRFIIGISINKNFSELAVFNIRNEMLGEIRIFERSLESSQAFVDGLYDFCMNVLGEMEIDLMGP